MELGTYMEKAIVTFVPKIIHEFVELSFNVYGYNVVVDFIMQSKF